MAIKLFLENSLWTLLAPLSDTDKEFRKRSLNQQLNVPEMWK